jgi:hypothetical protein
LPKGDFRESSVNDQRVRKYIKVWVIKRKNNPRERDKAPATSLTLLWLQDGGRKFQSLGRHATSDYAREAARRMEADLNGFAPARRAARGPLARRAEADRVDAFPKKYLKTKYPGHDLPAAERQEAQKGRAKSWASCRSERLALDNFGRLVMNEEGRENTLLHAITTEDRDNFVSRRMEEVPSAASVDTDLRVLRSVFNVAEEWSHVAEGRNPFAGKGKSIVGARPTRQRGRDLEAAGGKKDKHSTFDEVKAVLALATREAADAGEDDRWTKRRLRALVYFMAYTGCRFSEAVHLEWKDIDWDNGVATLFFKI